MERVEYEIVRARKFEVVDERGQLRGGMGPGPEGSTGMQFYNEEGEPKVEISVGRLKQWRSVATRYEKRAVTYRAMVVIATLMVWLPS